MLRTVHLLILPLLHHHVTVPEIAEDVTVEGFCCTTPKGIILEADGLAVGKPHLLEHSVAIPLIGIVTCLPGNMRATFLRHLVVLMPCQSTAWSLQYEVALYVIEIVIMAVTENPATLAVFPVATVTTAEDVSCDIRHTIVVHAVLIAEFGRNLHYSQMMLSSKFPNEIVRDFQFNFVKIIPLKSNNYALMLRKRLFYNAKSILYRAKQPLLEHKTIGFVIH